MVFNFTNLNIVTLEDRAIKSYNGYFTSEKTEGPRKLRALCMPCSDYGPAWTLFHSASILDLALESLEKYFSLFSSSD